MAAYRQGMTYSHPQADCLYTGMGSAPGPTLGNKYGRTLPFTFTFTYRMLDVSLNVSLGEKVIVEEEMLASMCQQSRLRSSLVIIKVFFANADKPSDACWISVHLESRSHCMGP